MPAAARRRLLRALLACALLLTLAPAGPAAGVAVATSAAGVANPAAPPEQSDEDLVRPSLREDLTEEVFYFVLPDRFANSDPANDTGGIPGGPLDHGFDPTDKGFYHGGDLAGLLDKLDYIEGLGVTALWMAPIFANRPVQGSGDDVSAGYHGYWVTDFTRVDPHFGTNDELRALVDGAHARGIKVFFDVITNHTADVIDYAEGVYDYVSKTAEPYRDADGDPFDDRDHAGTGDFPPLDATTSFPYTPVFRTPTDADVKVPEWLNDPTMYHNRGNSTFAGESALYGDFFGLDDLFTERPEVVRGMVDIHKFWISEFDIDGLRVDTVKHVNLEFWQQFGPEILAHAAAEGNDDFFLFGEVFDSDPAFMSTYTTAGRLPAVLDFGFQSRASGFASSSSATDALRDFFAADDLYIDADSNAYSLPTFLGNHDMGRIGHFLTRDNAGADDAELVARSRLAHELMYFTRGMPVVYSGDEQGFTGDGGDKDAREDMFASQVAGYNDNDLIGTDATTADDNFDQAHPLYSALADLAAVTAAHPALRSGAQIHRLSGDAAGVYAFSRIDRDEQVEYVVALNNAEVAQTVSVPTYSAGAGFSGVYPPGLPALTTDDGAGLALTVPPLSAVVYRADAPLAASPAAPAVTLTVPEAISGRAEIAATLDREEFAEVTFAVRAGDDAGWTVLGTDDNAPYRVFVDTADLAACTGVEFKAIVWDRSGNLDSDEAMTLVGGGEGPAASPDHAIIHYQRDDGDYDGWGLHLWGDLAEDEFTTWPETKPFDGEDDYGRFAWVRLADAAAVVNFIVHDPDGVKDVESDRGFDPRATPEVWLREGDPTIYTSQAAAEGFVTVRYQRDAGDYDDWGLHLWGDAIVPGAGTDWTAPRQRDGVDDYGAVYRVPIADATQPVNFIVHRPGGDEVPDTREPGGDRSFVPADTADVWLQQGDEAVYASRGAAEDFAVLHYQRPDGDYDGWGLHTWAGSANPTEWTAPLEPEGQDDFGLRFRVPLVDGATELAYIVHRGDEKDLPADQVLDLATFSHEVWILAGREGYLLPVTGGGGLVVDADLTAERAHWVSADTLVWDVEVATGTAYALHTAPDGGLAVIGGCLAGGEAIPLTHDPAGLSEELRARFPHFAGAAVFRVGPEDLARVPDALKGQLAVSATGPGGLAATGVQIPGVLDDLYANDADLGPTFDGDVPTLRLWAPTARSVTLHLFDDARPRSYSETVQMMVDPTTGVWTMTGDESWKGRYYLYEVEVYAPSTGRVEHNLVTDPYSVSLSANSARSQIVDLDDAALAPAGWDAVANPPLAAPEDISVYELHVRDFSITDETVPAAHRGTYRAFTDTGSDGMRHLRGLADAGLTHLHLLPVFDIATIEEVRSRQEEPEGDLSAFPPDSPEQQERVLAVADADGFNWGYDPLHYTTPEGSYATDPDGPARIVEFREMVAALNTGGLRVVMDVVYNHTAAAGQDEKSVLDRIVPGYYHRLLPDGEIATSTCCQNTATEHAMMEKLMVDSVVTWAREYKVDGFRFDLMGHHSRDNMLAVRAALDALTVEDDGVDGSAIYVYGEGWNFGEVADDARFVQATQANMAGTGIGTFNDRLRDAVRGGGPFDEDPRLQGFGSGLWTDPNDAPQGGDAEQRDRLLHGMDQIRVGLAGNLRGYTFTDRTGATVTGAEVDYNGSPAGYTDDPQENVVYVSAHDNETLYDALAFKLPQGTPMEERIRMQQLALSTVAFAQGVPFLHAGTDMLRSKSLDRNSYNSGDWFNRLDFSYSENNFGVGLPPRPDNESKWPFMQPLLADPALQPTPADIEWSVARFRELLAIRQSSPLFRLRTAEDVAERVTFDNVGPEQIPGLIVMTLSDEAGADLDAGLERIVVLLNAGDESVTFTQDGAAGRPLALHPVQASSIDPRARAASFDPATGTFAIPARTTAVFVEPTPDTTPPELTVAVSPDRLWPPNHRLVTVRATVTATDATDPDPTVELVSVTSSEPDAGTRGGDRSGDIVIVDERTFRLRAERSPRGDGRVYTITYRATDVSGNSALASAEVRVSRR